jgi:hypothetical protein
MDSCTRTILLISSLNYTPTLMQEEAVDIKIITLVAILIPDYLLFMCTIAIKDCFNTFYLNDTKAW